MEGREDIVASGMVQGLQGSESGEGAFSLHVDPAKGAAMETLRQQAEAAASAVPGVIRASAILTAERKPVADPHGMEKNPPLILPIRNIIVVASGKGGVGKSTVAFNLAVALKRMEKSVGLLDADIYGPSVPRLAGIAGAVPARENGRLIPLSAHGLKIMSMGFMVEEGKPVIWRGPMVQTALYQMLRDVEWGSAQSPLDTLIIDMPPGTGDAQLTLAQKVPVTGAVIVSTPQDLALIDARKAIAMFEKTGVPILGLIENMSLYHCPACGHEAHIFGHGGAREEAARRGIPFLGEIPLVLSIRQNSEDGVPTPDIFDEIARKLLP